LVAIIPEPKDKAFPSAHAAMAFAGAFAVLFHLPVGFGIAAMAFALIMGYSRMYVGVHYLSDVLGGLVTGLICAELLIMIELI
jgi:undecaprenyl-diphosphatase